MRVEFDYVNAVEPEPGLKKVRSVHSATTEDPSERQAAAQRGGHIGDLQHSVANARHVDETSNAIPLVATTASQVGQPFWLTIEALTGEDMPFRP